MYQDASEGIGWSQATILNSDLPPRAQREPVLQEMALSLVINGAPYAVMMITPLDQDDFVRGFLWGEGVLQDLNEIIAWEWVRGEGGDAAYLQLAAGAAERVARKRRCVVGASACGLCGTPCFEELVPFSSLCDERVVPAGLIHERMDHMVCRQVLNRDTGTAHAAILASATETLVREDIGRHNAVDKVIGAALARGWRRGDATFLGVSSRLSFEIALKALGFAVPVVAAISGVSSLAVQTAERHGLSLIGYARDRRMTVYAHPERLALRSAAKGGA